MKVTQSCLTLQHCVNCNPPGSSVHGILQARIWSGVPFPSPGHLPNQGLNPGLLHCRHTEFTGYCILYSHFPSSFPSNTEALEFQGLVLRAYNIVTCHHWELNVQLINIKCCTNFSFIGTINGSGGLIFHFPFIINRYLCNFPPVPIFQSVWLFPRYVA